MATKIVTVSELKGKLASLIVQLASDTTPIYVTQHGKPQAVLVGFEEYEAMREKLEDLEDALAMHQALASPEDEAVTLEAYQW
jgi:antitoxin YefM